MRRLFVLMREDGPGEKVLNSRSFSMILPALWRGESLLNSPAALMTSRFRQRCFRAAGCSPHPPSCACKDHEKLAAHSKPFSPGPSFPLPNTVMPLFGILSSLSGSSSIIQLYNKNRAILCPVLAILRIWKEACAPGGRIEFSACGMPRINCFE